MKTETTPQTQITTGLFATLLLLQVLDLHSTLMRSPTGEAETNPLIGWLAGVIGFANALGLVKFVAAAVTFYWWDAWRKSHQNSWFLVSILATLIVILGLVVTNNYFTGIEHSGKGR